MINIGSTVKFTDEELRRNLDFAYSTNHPGLCALLRGESVKVTLIYADKSAYIGCRADGTLLALPLHGLECVDADV